MWLNVLLNEPRVAYCELWVLFAPLPNGCRCSRKIRLSRNLGYKTRWGGAGGGMRNVALNDPRVAYCELWVLLPLCPMGVGTRGKFFLSRHMG